MPGRILIADDSPTIRRLIRGILQFKGYEIAEASTGDEAIEAIGAKPERCSSRSWI
jgi:CheY-like chemotaxis protein